MNKNSTVSVVLAILFIISTCYLVVMLLTIFFLIGVSRTPFWLVAVAAGAGVVSIATLFALFRGRGSKSGIRKD